MTAGVDWRSFARMHLLVAGMVLLAAGTVFFFAANWEELGTHARVGILGLSVALAAAVGALRPGEDLVGRMSVLLAAVLVGPLLAVIEQTYHLGSEIHRLLALWALLATAFALVARFDGLWVVWLVLWNGAAWFRCAEVSARAESWDALIPAALASWIAVRLWELGAERGISWCRSRWPARVGAALALAAAVWPAFLWLVDVLKPERIWSVPLHLILATGGIGWMVLRYRRRIPDLSMLALAAAGVNFLLAGGLGRILYDWFDLELFGGFLLGLALIVQALVTARWLLRMRAEMGGES